MSQQSQTTIKVLKNLHLDNKKKSSLNQELIEKYNQTYQELSKLEKEIIEKNNNNSDLDFKIKLTQFEEKLKQNCSKLLSKQNQEELLLILEAIKLVVSAKKIDISTELEKGDLDFYLKFLSEFSQDTKNDDLLGEKIITIIEGMVNIHHQSGKIKEIEIGQESSSIYKFDNNLIELYLDNDILKLKETGGLFEDWLVKTFAIRKNVESSNKELKDVKDNKNKSTGKTASKKK